ncbi:MAG TPA: hypothetical protein VNM24_03940 [Burkholderiales bacterium]|jgi:hypothetical protein|nr:hypothetical protein [Burkholderiales bacterium]
MKKNALRPVSVPCLALFFLFFVSTVVLAQAQPFKVGEVYRCADGQVSIQVTRCYGEPTRCDVELYQAGATQPVPNVAFAEVNNFISFCTRGAAGATPPGPPPAGGGDRAAAGGQEMPRPAPGQPPRAGFVSCAGKIEGRYSSPEAGSFTVVFKSGKARLRMYGVDDEEVECWISGRRILLHKAGTEEELELDINDDGTLDSPMGELKKRGG